MVLGGLGCLCDFCCEYEETVTRANTFSFDTTLDLIAIAVIKRLRNVTLCTIPRQRDVSLHMEQLYRFVWSQKTISAEQAPSYESDNLGVFTLALDAIRKLMNSVTGRGDGAIARFQAIMTGVCITK